MKLKDYIKYLNVIAKKYPDVVVVSASDDEGNLFSEVQFTPTLGTFEKGDFEDRRSGSKKINCVCIN